MNPTPPRVPFLDLKSQYLRIKPEIDVLLADIFDQTAFVCGKYTAALEKEFGALLGVRHVLAVGNGTEAEHLMLWASGIRPGDEVILPVNTFIATAEAVSVCGATPVFVDNDPISYNLDLSKVESAITPRTKALLPVHLYGQPVDMDALQEIANRHGLLVFEDACQAHLAKWREKCVGSFGKAAAFSFFPGKNLGAYGEAGAVCTNDSQLYETMLRMRNHGCTQRYVHELVGHNFRIDEIQAAVLVVKLKYLQAWNARRRAVAQLYRQRLAGLAEVTCPVETPCCEPVYHLFVVRVPAGRRDALRSFLEQRGIGTGIHYPVPLHLQRAYAHLGRGPGSFPVAERQTTELLSLPMCPELSDAQVEHVCQAVRRFFHE